MKPIISYVLGLIISSIVFWIGWQTGYSIGQHQAKQYYNLENNSTKIIYQEDIHAFAFKVSDREGALEIYAPNFIIDNSKRDTIYASKFILTTDVISTP